MKTCSLKGSPSEPFSSADVAEVLQLFEANLDIQGSGMVVAAPDHNTGPGGDYYFAWMRDGALSMNSLLQVKAFDSDVETKMDHWLSWVERIRGLSATWTWTLGRSRYASIGLWFSGPMVP